MLAYLNDLRRFTRKTFPADNNDGDMWVPEDLFLNLANQSPDLRTEKRVIVQHKNYAGLIFW